MTCQDLERILSDYLEDTLSGAERAEAKAHLSVCPACRQMADEVSWVIEKCGQFPVMEPSPLLRERILERTSRARTGRNILALLTRGVVFQQRSPVYLFASAIMILLVIGVLFNAYGIIRGFNRYTHQAYSKGVKIYYQAEELKEGFANLKEDLPNKLDTGIVKGVDWIKGKMPKKEDEKDKKKEERKDKGESKQAKNRSFLQQA